LTIQIGWSNLSTVPTQHVNQFVVQVGAPAQDGTPDGIYLAVGHVAPPVIVSSDPEMQAREIRAVKSGVQVEVLGRFHIDRARAEELVKVLQATLANYDASAELYRTMKNLGAGDSSDG
jgi:hypothetical protein